MYTKTYYAVEVTVNCIYLRKMHCEYKQIIHLAILLKLRIDAIMCFTRNMHYENCLHLLEDQIDINVL